MCRYLDSAHIMPGWGCCRCKCYNGIRATQCRNCGASRCEPIQPDRDTGRVFIDRVHRHADYEFMFTPERSN
jgi:ribosomal protein L40E